MSFLATSELWANFQTGRDLLLFSPMIALTCTMLLVVSFPIVVGRGARKIGAASTFGMIVALLLAIRVLGQVSTGGVSGLSAHPLYGLLIADNLSVGFQVVLLVFMIGVTILWWMGSADTEKNAPEFFILLVGSAVGMTLMVSTTNLLMMVIAIEMASIPSYAIVGFDKRDRIAAEASLKYMVFGAVCAAIMLYGASLIYGLVGSLSMQAVAAYTFQQLTVGGENAILLGVALFCVLAGIAFKISAVPFHFWCPDAFQGAKIEVTTWLSVASKAAGLVLLTRFVSLFGAAVPSEHLIGLLSPLAWTIGIMAAVTCTVGNFAAYKQNSVKRMLAYSSIAHAGYMMMAASIFAYPGTAAAQNALPALAIYIVIYLFMNLCAFGVTAIVSWDAGTDDIAAFNGLAWRSPLLAIPMIIALMSLVGLPPLAGFFGKWWILVALGKSGTILGWTLVVVLAVNTLISLYYYMRVIVMMALRDEGKQAVLAPLGGLALVNACAVVLLVLFIWINPLWREAGRYTSNLFSVAATSPVGDAALASSTEESRP